MKMKRQLEAPGQRFRRKTGSQCHSEAEPKNLVFVKAAAFIVAAMLAALPHSVHAQRINQGERQVPPAVQACIGCHGSRGEGNPESGSPRIAGQSAYYLLKQLDSYVNGSRRDRVMEPIARGLPPELRA